MTGRLVRGAIGVLLCIPVLAHAQEYSLYAVSYETGRSKVVSERPGTRQTALAPLYDQLSDPSIRITGITITAYSSPDEPASLSSSRAASLRSSITSSFPAAAPLISVSPLGADPEYLSSLIRDTRSLSERFEVLAILRDNPDPGAAFQRLRSLYGGRTWSSLRREVFPRMQRASVRVEFSPVEEDPTLIQLDSALVLDRAVPISDILSSVDTVSGARLRVVEQKVSRDTTVRFDIGLGTNLAYLLALTPNLSFEVPVSYHLTVFGECVFPWWTASDNSWAWQMLSSTLGVRYYFSDWRVRRDFSGWFIGLSSSIGLFDIERSAKGYQGEFAAVSFEGGYGLPIGKDFNLSFFLGLGWAGTRYRRYAAEHGNQYLVYMSPGTRSLLTPTRGGVTLTYTLHHDMKRQKTSTLIRTSSTSVHRESR